jgi:hypothetical protein
MTDITVANADWEIVEDLATALAVARIDGDAVFSAVAVTTSAQQAKEAQFRGSGARAVLRYVGTGEAESPEGVRACTVSVELILAAKVTSATADEADRLREILRLVNAAKNAIEAAVPATACYWQQGGTWRDRLQWSSPSIDTAEMPPWVVGVVPLTVSYTLEGPTAH